MKKDDEIICSEKTARTADEIEDSPGSTFTTHDEMLQYSCSMRKGTGPTLIHAGNHDYIHGEGSFTVSKIVPPSSKNHAETFVMKFKKNGKCSLNSGEKESTMYCKTEMEYIDPKDLGTIDMQGVIKEALMPSERKGLVSTTKRILMEDFDLKDTVIHCITKRKHKKGKIVPMNACLVTGSSESGKTWPTLKSPVNMNRIDLSGNMSFYIMDGFAANKIYNSFKDLSEAEKKEWKEENEALAKSFYHSSVGWPLFIMVPEKSTDVTCKVHRFTDAKKNIVAKEMKCINTPTVAQPRSGEKLIEALDIATEKKRLLLENL